MTNKINRAIEFAQKRISSIIYRLLISAYGICMVNMFENTFPYYICILLSLFYPIPFLVLRKNDILRLVIDFSYILFILYNKPVLDFRVLFLIFLPIINSPNFTGKKKNNIICLNNINIHDMLLSLL